MPRLFCGENNEASKTADSTEDTDRQILLEHATSANIGRSLLQPTRGDDDPLGVVPDLQGPPAGSAGVLQPGISVQGLEILVELLLQGVPQHQLATVLALCQQGRSTACGSKSEAGFSGLFCSDLSCDVYARTGSMS